ncbi:hypothetical protein CSPAE12_06266 [Colletotrichum incanum]|nr:hypothetical protein CSPAE12_06266 [Colletotrichum incanum]
MTDQQKVRFLAASKTFGCRVNGSQVAGPGR